METQYPGFSYDLIRGVLKRAEVQNQVDMTESLLRLEGLNNSDGEKQNMINYIQNCLLNKLIVMIDLKKKFKFI